MPKKYPKETHGTKLAAEVRKKANKLTNAERKELYAKGMKIIYGDPNSSAPPDTSRKS